MSFTFNQPLLGYPPETYLNLVAVALLAQVGGWLAINYALGHLRASLIAPTLLGQPVITALLAVPLLGQSLSAVQVLGGLLVLSGIYIVHRTKTT
jgi:drug/metabolite transporter (DMT)-like permease